MSCQREKKPALPEICILDTPGLVPRLLWMEVEILNSWADPVVLKSRPLAGH